MHALRGKYRGRMVFHLLENAEQRNEEVEAIHHQTDTHQTDERYLVITQCIAHAAFEAIDAVWEDWTRKFAVPRNAGLGCAGNK